MNHYLRKPVLAAFVEEQIHVLQDEPDINMNNVILVTLKVIQTHLFLYCIQISLSFCINMTQNVIRFTSFFMPYCTEYYAFFQNNSTLSTSVHKTVVGAS